MRNRARGFATLLLLCALLALILIGGGFYALNHEEMKGSEVALVTTSEAPAILPRTLRLVDSEGPPALPSPVTVTSSAGDSVVLKLVMQFPADKGVLTGMYAYQNYLYKYVNGAFTYLPESDASTFAVIPIDFGFHQYGKDRNNVYCFGDVLAGADTSTFEIIPPSLVDDPKYNIVDYWHDPDWEVGQPGHITFQDKNHEYIYGECKPYVRS